MRNLCRPVLTAFIRLHHLQVVDQHQPKAVFALQAARTAAQLHRCQTGRVINKNWRLRQQAHGRRNAGPVFLVKSAGTNLMGVDPAHGCEHTHRQLFTRHFHTEYSNRQLLTHGHIFGDIHCQRGFSHRWAPGNDNKVCGLKAGCHFI